MTLDEQQTMLEELNLITRLDLPWPTPTDQCPCCGARLSARQQRVQARRHASKRYGTASLSDDWRVARAWEMIYRGFFPTRDHS